MSVETTSHRTFESFLAEYQGPGGEMKVNELERRHKWRWREYDLRYIPVKGQALLPLSELLSGPPESEEPGRIGELLA